MTDPVHGPGAPRGWWYVVLAAVLVGVIGLLLPDSSWRLAVLVLAMLWAPGAAAVGSLPGLDRTTRLSLVPGVSAAIVLLGSSLMVEAHFWHPIAFLAVLTTWVCVTSLFFLATVEEPSTGSGRR